MLFENSPITRYRKGNENSVELAGVELAVEKTKWFNPVQFLFLMRVIVDFFSRSLSSQGIVELAGVELSGKIVLIFNTPCI